jgi:hypothetical protein
MAVMVVAFWIKVKFARKEQEMWSIFLCAPSTFALIVQQREQQLTRGLRIYL